MIKIDKEKFNQANQCSSLLYVCHQFSVPHDACHCAHTYYIVYIQICIIYIRTYIHMHNQKYYKNILIGLILPNT